MDMREFSKYIIGLGIAIILGGGFVVKTASDEYQKDRKSLVELLHINDTSPNYPLYLPGIKKSVAEESGYLPAMRKAEAERTNGFFICLAGAIVAFIGGAIIMSARPKQA